MRGAVRFLAGVLFPTSGHGNLRTTFGSTVRSELLLTAPSGRQGGFYEYQSEIDLKHSRTLMTSHGYAWGNKSRSERIVFDYVKRLVRIHKRTPEETEHRVKKLPERGEELRDILTAIYFLRQNADGIGAPLQTTIYSDGKEYAVVFRPGEERSFAIGGRPSVARAFHITDAPGGREWPGGVTVWLTTDERRLPVRIEVEKSVAAVQLDLVSMTDCRALQAQL